MTRGFDRRSFLNLTLAASLFEHPSRHAMFSAQSQSNTTYTLTVTDSSGNQKGTVSIEDEINIDELGGYLSFSTIGDTRDDNDKGIIDNVRFGSGEVIENWETRALSDYTRTNNDGGEFEITNSPTANGSRALMLFSGCCGDRITSNETRLSITDGARVDADIRNLTDNSDTFAHITKLSIGTDADGNGGITVALINPGSQRDEGARIFTPNSEGRIDFVPDLETFYTFTIEIEESESAEESPTATFDFSPTAPTTEDTITLDASESSDPDGTIQAYEWDIGDDGSFDLTGETVETKIEEPGGVPITLRVTDNDGLSQTTTKTVEVRIPNLEEKLDLIQQIRSVSRAGPTEISPREVTESVPADGGNEVVGFLTKDQSMRFESSAEDFIQDLADRGDSVSAERADNFAEAAKQFKVFERTTKTAAISGIPISARGGEFLSGAVLASIPAIGGPLAKSSRFSPAVRNVLRLINEFLGNSLIQDIIESISDTITRLVRRLLGSYSGNDKMENAIQSLNSSFEEQFTEDELESLGLKTLTAVKEAKEENGWEFRPDTLLSDGEEEVSPLGEKIIQTQLNAASGTDTFDGIINLLERFERSFGKKFYELFIFDRFESLNDIVDNVADDLETELDNFDLSSIDINTLIQITERIRNQIKELTGSALSVYSVIDRILIGIATLQLLGLISVFLIAVQQAIAAYIATGSLILGVTIGALVTASLGPLLAFSEYLSKVYVLVAGASAASASYVQGAIVNGHADAASQIFKSNRN